MNYTDPSFIHPDRNSGTRVKRVSEMSLAELRERTDREALQIFKAEYEADPLNPQKKAQYEQYCGQVGVRPDAEIERLYDIPKEKLVQEFEQRGKAVEDSELEKWRISEAKRWMASQPAYEPDGASAEKIFNELQAQGLKGSVYELQMAFDALVARGELQPREIITPVKLPSVQDAYGMPLAELKKLAEQSNG